jgi:hypothetical protein
MAKKPKSTDGFCTYASIKVDDEILPLCRAAAAFNGNVATQEFISDILNEHVSKALGRTPIKRRKPKPRA